MYPKDHQASLRFRRTLRGSEVSPEVIKARFEGYVVHSAGPSKDQAQVGDKVSTMWADLIAAGEAEVALRRKGDSALKDARVARDAARAELDKMLMCEDAEARLANREEIARAGHLTMTLAKKVADAEVEIMEGAGEHAAAINAFDDAWKRLYNEAKAVHDTVVNGRRQ